MGSPSLNSAEIALLLGPTGTTTSSIMPKKANIFDSFSHSAIQQFKEAFGIMDADKDGLLSSSDDDDVILASFEAFEIDGKIDADAFRHSLMTFGVKFSASEVDDAFAEMKIDEGMIDAAHLKGLMVSK